MIERSRLALFALGLCLAAASPALAADVDAEYHLLNPPLLACEKQYTDGRYEDAIDKCRAVEQTLHEQREQLIATENQLYDQIRRSRKVDTTDYRFVTTYWSVREQIMYVLMLSTTKLGAPDAGARYAKEQITSADMTLAFWKLAPNVSPAMQKDLIQRRDEAEARFPGTTAALRKRWAELHPGVPFPE